MRSKDHGLRVGLVAFTLLMLALPAFAYLDPSTGSMILSAIVGLFATLGLAVKTYWYKLKAFFRPADDSLDRPDPVPAADSPDAKPSSES